MNKLIARLLKQPLWNAAGGGAAGGTPSGAPPQADPAPAPSLLGGEPNTPPVGEGNPPATPPAEPAAPLTVQDITLPEGVSIPDETMTEFLGLMNDAQLSPNERANKLINLQQNFITSSLEAVGKQLETNWKDTQDQWRSQSQALPEIGGAKLPETLATIKKGLDAVGASKETYAALDLTGAGNHPEVIRVLHALTKNLAEGRPVSGGPTKGPLTHADKMFGGMKQE